MTLKDAFARADGPTLSARCRLEFVAGAEERSRRVEGRPLTAEELERVLRHYPGDPDALLARWEAQREEGWAWPSS